MDRKLSKGLPWRSERKHYSVAARPDNCVKLWQNQIRQQATTPALSPHPNGNINNIIIASAIVPISVSVPISGSIRKTST